MISVISVPDLALADRARVLKIQNSGWFDLFIFQTDVRAPCASGWKLRSHAGSRLRANFSCLIEKCELLPSCLINFQKYIYVNSDPCKERKPCVKWINNNTFLPISVFWSEKHWERACVYTRSKMRGLFPLSSQTDVFGRLRTFSGLFGNDRVVFKNLSTPRIKISRLYFWKSWQV